MTSLKIDSIIRYPYCVRSLLNLICGYELQVSFIMESGIDYIPTYPHFQVGCIDETPSI